MSLLVWPGRLGKTRKDKNGPHESRFHTYRPQESPHIPLHPRASEEHSERTFYARTHCWILTIKHVWECNPLRIFALPVTDGRVRGDESDRNPPCGPGPCPACDPRVSALLCALAEYFTRPLYAWQYLPKESTVEEWAESRGGYRLPAWLVGGTSSLWICRKGRVCFWWKGGGGGEPSVTAEILNKPPAAVLWWALYRISCSRPQDVDSEPEGIGAVRAVNRRENNVHVKDRPGDSTSTKVLETEKSS